MTDEVKEIETGLSILANNGTPMSGTQWDKFSNACLRSVATIRALQEENEGLREVLGKINAIEDAEYPSEDEYGYESCHVEGYNAGLSECRKTILLALKDTPND